MEIIDEIDDTNKIVEYQNRTYLIDLNDKIKIVGKEKESAKTRRAETETISQNKTVTLPDWFMKAENDAIRVATINQATKYFENFAKRTNGGGNEAKIVRALKALNPKHFQKYLLKKKPEGQATVNLDDLKKILPGQGLNDEDYIAVLNILEEVSDAKLEDTIDEKYLEEFNKKGKAQAIEIRNAALQNTTILVQTRGFIFNKDLPLKVDVVGNDNFRAPLFGQEGAIMSVNLTRSELDKVTDGKILEKNGETIAQAQGNLFALEKTNQEILRFYGQDGRDINLDQAVFD